jgi:hypothetical protein
MIGNSCIQQFDVKADVERDTDGDWYVSTIYSDVIEQDGKCPQGECWVEIPTTHPLHNAVLMHFLTNCSADIDEKWAERRTYRYTSTISAGRTFA